MHTAFTVDHCGVIRVYDDYLKASLIFKADPKPEKKE